MADDWSRPLLDACSLGTYAMRRWWSGASNAQSRSFVLETSAADRVRLTEGGGRALRVRLDEEGDEEDDGDEEAKDDRKEGAEGDLEADGACDRRGERSP